MDLPPLKAPHRPHACNGRGILRGGLLATEASTDRGRAPTILLLLISTKRNSSKDAITSGKAPETSYKRDGSGAYFLMNSQGENDFMRAL